MKEYKIQVRVEVYETYIIKVDTELEDDEAIEQAIKKLDKALGDETYIESSFKDFGGFTSIEEKKDGKFERLLGEPIQRHL
jgi:hypothetical protein|tara:strand:- start:3149 stop:3391 length:243 start_codon:yes stop_codon:yes gene_type:complete